MNMDNLTSLNVLEIVTDDKDFAKALSIAKQHNVMRPSRISAFGISLIQCYVRKEDMEGLLNDCFMHNIDAYIRDVE